MENYTYWKKGGVVREANSFVEDEQLRKDGWIKAKRSAYEYYKRSLEKSDASKPPAAVEPAGDWLYPDGNAPEMKMYPTPEERVKELESELARVRSERDAAVAALQPFAELYEKWVNRLIEDQYFPEWLEIKLTVAEQQGWYTRQWFEDAAKALQAAAPASGEEGA